MSHTPEPIAAFDGILAAFTFAHETIFGYYRSLLELEAVDDAARDLLADAVHVTLTELPLLLERARELRHRWTDESLLDSAAADRTAVAVADELDRARPEVIRLRARMAEIARAMKVRRDAARGA